MSQEKASKSEAEQAQVFGEKFFGFAKKILEGLGVPEQDGYGNMAATRYGFEASIHFKTDTDARDTLAKVLGKTVSGDGNLHVVSLTSNTGGGEYPHAVKIVDVQGLEKSTLQNFKDMSAIFESASAACTGGAPAAGAVQAKQKVTF